MKKISLLTFLILALTNIQNTSARDQQTAFFESLSALCGERFEGRMTFPKEGQDNFAGKRLVATIKSCTDTEIRMLFHVAEDHSRTWIISKTNAGLQLKHDHRHDDGTADEINMYGGLAGLNGTALRQSFFADTHTSAIIPEASTNVWTMSLSEDMSSFTYHLERHGSPRFTAKLAR